jgi:hypothetical protein
MRIATRRWMVRGRAEPWILGSLAGPVIKRPKSVAAMLACSIVRIWKLASQYALARRAAIVVDAEHAASRALSSEGLKFLVPAKAFSSKRLYCDALRPHDKVFSPKAPPAFA